MQANKNKAASSTDPSTWVSFSEAVAAVSKGYYDYIGYVFTNNGIVGIDIDAGRNDEGLMSDLAVDIIEHCKSYTEYSKSRRGVHIFVKGTLPFKGKNNRDGVEIYREGRFFICTGNSLLYDSLAENQSGIDYVVDKYFGEFTMPEREEKTGRTHKVARVQGASIYKPEWKMSGKKLSLTYPAIQQGGRNISLLSLGGQLINNGLSDAEIYQELVNVNQIACHPPLSDDEIDRIYKSVMRYKL